MKSKRRYTLLQWLWYAQRMIIYPCGFFDMEDESSYHPFYYGLPYSHIKFKTKDNVTLQCVLFKDDSKAAVQRSRGTFIMFHGNAMTQSSLFPYARIAYSAGFNALTVEYRGYQFNDGIPSEKGLQRDAQAALDYVLADPILSTKPVIIFGQSLGGAVAIDLTRRNASKISALIVENSFTSIPDIVWGRFPLLLKWISIFCTQRWHSLNKIKNLPPSMPLLMLSGLRDEVVPPAHMQHLWDVAQTRHEKPGGILNWVRTMLSRARKEDADQNSPSRDEFCTFPGGCHDVSMPQQPHYAETFCKFLDTNFPNAQVGGRNSEL